MPIRKWIGRISVPLNIRIIFAVREPIGRIRLVEFNDRQILGGYSDTRSGTPACYPQP